MIPGRLFADELDKEMGRTFPNRATLASSESWLTKLVREAESEWYDLEMAKLYGKRGG